MLSLAYQSGPVDPSQTLQNTNALIQQLNTNVPGLYGYSYTAGSNGADATDDTLQSFTLLPGLLGANGKAVRIKAWGVTANNSDTKTLKLKFGVAPLVVVNQALTVSTANPWELEAIIMRSGATSQIAWGRVIHGAAVLGVFQSTAGAETMANALALLVTGASGSSAAADITCNGALVELIQ